MKPEEKILIPVNNINEAEFKAHRVISDPRNYFWCKGVKLNDLLSDIIKKYKSWNDNEYHDELLKSDEMFIKTYLKNSLNGQ